jgi:hypothetical protein
MEPRHPAISTFGVGSNLPTHFVRHRSTVQRPTSQSTKNRYITTLRTLLNMCEKMQ